MRRSFTIIVCLLALCARAYSQGNLPELAKAPEITVGSLPNGIKYYLAVNRHEPGFADFALVQPAFRDPEAARHNLVSLPCFKSRRPCDFLADKGVSYAESGYVSFRGGNTTYDFRSVPLAVQQVTDSVILMMMGFADTFQGEQAIVISGDIAADKILERLNLFSMTVSSRTPRTLADNYEWVSSPAPSCYYSANRSSGVSSIRVTYSSQRVPRDRMNTLQPLVTRLYSKYLGMILERRISADFKASGIPVGALEYRYRDSSSGQGNEMYTIAVTTSSGKYDEAVRHVASILSDLDERGATLEEFTDAKNRLVADASRDAGNIRLSNHEYVTRCIQSYLYNASLAPDSVINDFFARTRLTVDKDLEFFNSFASALLDPEKNLILGFDTPSASVNSDLLKAFDEAWRTTAADNSGKTYAAEGRGKARFDQSQSRAKFVSETKEPVSEGSMWKFSNGMRVIYKQAPTKGEFVFALQLRGGAGLVPGLGAGENAFVGDMMSLYDVAGLDGESFRNELTASGIQLKTEVSLSDMRISGKAPKGSLSLLLKALLAIANDRRMRQGDFEYYKSCEMLREESRRLSSQGIHDVLDSLLFPDSFYRSYKSLANMRDDLLGRTDTYFDSQFAKCGDGILVFSGDLDEENLKKELSSCLGGFSTGKVTAAKPRVSTRMLAGISTFTADAATASVGDGQPSVNMALSAPLNVNSSSSAALEIVRMALSDKLAGALLSTGARAEVTLDVSLYPREQGIFHIECRPCPSFGLPEGIEPQSALSILAALRKAMDEFFVNPYSISSIAAYKTRALAERELTLGTVDGRMEAVMMRYSDNKDMVSGYRDAINRITEKDIYAIIESMKADGRVEYVLL